MVIPRCMFQSSIANYENQASTQFYWCEFVTCFTKPPYGDATPLAMLGLECYRFVIIEVQVGNGTTYCS
jgi:hypothetical protein